MSEKDIKKKKSIKIDREVYEYLSNELRKGESFSEGLKRILGLRPSLESLQAYFEENTREKTQEMIEVTRDIADFKEEITEGDYDDELHFYPPEGNHTTVAKVRFMENKSIFKYKNKEGEFEEIARFKNNREDRISEATKKRWKTRVKGAVRKWADAEEILSENEG